MVRIRLARGGAKGRPFYHIVVADQRSRRDGRNIERLGYYNPVASGAEKRLLLDVEKTNAWVAKGAQMSDKVRALLKEAGSQAPAEEQAAA
ncbi:MAG TPA: 30S ribosomal protein S16 [Oleiagrimonas sp.]|nr:30S ribosomal protein S16 [Oleiagrimonas sp.]